MAASSDTSASGSDARLTAVVTGIVQGVGFRFWTCREAGALGLSGVVSNELDGSVRIVAEGPKPALAELLQTLRSGETAGEVDQVKADFSSSTGEFSGFHPR